MYSGCKESMNRTDEIVNNLSFYQLPQFFRSKTDSRQKKHAYDSIIKKIAQLGGLSVNQQNGKFTLTKTLQLEEVEALMANLGYACSNTRIPIIIERTLGRNNNCINGYIVYGEGGYFVADEKEQPIPGLLLATADVGYEVTNFDPSKNDDLPFTIDWLSLRATKKIYTKSDQYENIRISARIPLQWHTADATVLYPAAVIATQATNSKYSTSYSNPSLTDFETKRVQYSFLTENGFVYFPHMTGTVLRELNSETINAQQNQ